MRKRGKNSTELGQQAKQAATESETVRQEQHTTWTAGKAGSYWEWNSQARAAHNLDSKQSRQLMRVKQSGKSSTQLREQAKQAANDNETVKQDSKQIRDSSPKVDTEWLQLSRVARKPFGKQASEEVVAREKLRESSQAGDAEVEAIARGGSSKIKRELPAWKYWGWSNCKYWFAKAKREAEWD